MERTVRLGPFELEQRLGRGASGEVWAAVHRTERVRVAIKVLTTARAREPGQVAAFRQEARAMAALDHPAIAAVFDLGAVDGDAQEASGGRLVAGSPWIAMERASGGSLAGSPPRSWPALRGVLAEILDALGHAHARGVIHRDLKPGNVLLCTDRDLRPGTRLADFGIAWAGDAPHASEPRAGTVPYMAPEQIRGEVRSFGPWTDLYALGCLATVLATGQPVFTRATPQQIARAHLYEPPDLHAAAFPAPAGFGAWVAILLRKDPAARFRCAADAAAALRALGADALFEGPGAAGDERTVEDIDTTALLQLSVGGAPRRTDEAPGPAAPLPEDWRASAPPPLPPRWVAAGLGVFALRARPVVGREGCRDRLWRALIEVHEAGRARAVALCGPEGIGARALARWIGERACELGAAEAIAGRSAADLAERTLHARGLSGEALQRWLVEGSPWAAPLEAEVAAAIRALLGDPGAPVRLERPRERWEAARRAMAATAARPLVARLHAAPDGVELARWLSEAPEAPVLLVLTGVPPGALPEGVETVEVPPMAREELLVLVQGALGIRGPLTVRIAERAHGSPMLALALLDDLVQRGALAVGPDGLTLREGAELQLPGDLAEVWASRVDGVCAQRPPFDRTALHVAAALGSPVSPERWSEACAALGGAPAPDLQDVLLSSGLAVADGPGWAFAPGLLREALLEDANRRGCAAAVHRACAEALARRGDADPEARGRHLLAAGDPEPAVALLLDAARARRAVGDLPGARMVLEEHEAASEAAGIPGDSRLRIEAGVLHSELARLQGLGEEAERSARSALALALAAGQVDLAADARRVLALIARRDGDLDGALALIEAARPGAEAAGPRLRGLVAFDEGVTRHERGDLDAAEAAFARAEAAFGEIGASDWLGHCARATYMVAKQRGDLATAARRLDRAAEHYARAGSRVGLANVAGSRGEIARMAGDLDAAEAHYREALRGFTLLAEANVAIVRVNLGLLAIERGRAAEALAHLRAAASDRRAPGLLAGPVHAFLAAAEALAGSFGACAAHLEQAEALLGAHADIDVAKAAALVAERAEAAGEGATAARARALAASQRARLGITG